MATENDLTAVAYRNILLVALTTNWSNRNRVTSNENSLLIVVISVNAEDETSASLGSSPDLIVLGEPVELWVGLGADVETKICRISECFILVYDHKTYDLPLTTSARSGWWKTSKFEDSLVS